MEPQLRSTDLSAFATAFEAVHGLSGTQRDAGGCTSLARDHLVREQALRVLREAFRCEPSEVGVLLVEEDGWEHEVWPLPGG